MKDPGKWSEYILIGIGIAAIVLALIVWGFQLWGVVEWVSDLGHGSFLYGLFKAISLLVAMIHLIVGTIKVFDNIGNFFSSKILAVIYIVLLISGIVQLFDGVLQKF